MDLAGQGENLGFYWGKRDPGGLCVRREAGPDSGAERPPVALLLGGPTVGAEFGSQDTRG